MSYILEALKKSQQERELGRVPTLDSPAPDPDEPLVRTGYWGMTAVLLAALAVIIALYAALRGAAPPAMDDAASAPIAKAPPLPESASPPEPQSAVVPAEPVAAPRASPAVPTAVQDEPPAATLPEPAPAAVPTQDGPIEVPEDLRQEIEAFKKQVRQERGGGKKKAPASADVPPQKLRLPREVAQRMPAFLMTVHRYDADPAERFVLINARKIREGEDTREGIRVEQILPDGAVLRYDGHRFFHHR